MVINIDVFKFKNIYIIARYMYLFPGTPFTNMV